MASVYLNWKLAEMSISWFEHSPQVFTRLGHIVTGYLHRQWISVIPYLDDWLVYTQTVKFTLPPSQLLSLDLGRALLPEFMARERVA